jgi:hypothetical protein
VRREFQARINWIFIYILARENNLGTTEEYERRENTPEREKPSVLLFLWT